MKEALRTSLGKGLKDVSRKTCLGCLLTKIRRFLGCLYDCIVVGLSMVEGLFSLLFYCESGINQFVVQKSLTDAFGASCYYELGCLRYIVLLYHLRMLRVFMTVSKSFI